MKKLFLFILFAGSNLFAQTTNGPVITSIDGYAARVNNRIITYGDIRESIAPVMQQLFKHYHGEELARQMQELHIQGREQLIGEALMLEEAKRMEFSLRPEVIDDEIRNLIQHRFDGDRIRLNRALAKQRMTMKEWRQKVTDQLIVQVYYNREVLQKINITEEDIQAEYDRIKEEKLAIPFRVKYRFILINKGKTKEEQAVKREQAERILKKLRDGADFVPLAEDVSEGDPSLSPWRDPADVKKELRPALFNTPAGGISDLIDAGGVFYIINVESRQEEGYVPLEEVREKIKEALTAQERDRLYKELIDRLSARHYVQRY